MRNKLLPLLFLFPVVLQAQSEIPVIHEVNIVAKLSYGTHTLYIKANDDNTFQYNILDMDNNHTLMTGKVTALEPLNRTGDYSFNTPDGESYVSGFYSNNIPFRAWKYTDENGQVSKSLNYSAAIQYLQNFGDVDIGDDYVFEARKAPKFGRKGMDDFLKFIAENGVYPPFPMITQEEGRVVCQFVIDKSGQLINARIVEGVNEDLDLEVLRILSLSPKWKPGKIKGGDPVNVMYKLAVNFQLPD
jgi:TonB family protein